MNPRRLDWCEKGMCFLLQDSCHRVKTKVPKCSGTWLGSRLTTQVGCQHKKRRWGSAPSPSMRQRLTRHFVPAPTFFSLTECKGTRAAAYQLWYFLSIRPGASQPECQSA